MAVVIETTLGDITVDLYLDQRPVTCLNFLKLCKMKYYNFNLFHSIRSGFIAQTGDPTGEGSGGQSIFGLLEGPEKRFFSGEKMPKIRHADTGLLSMVCTGEMMVGSQFFFTLAPDLDSLDGVHCVIGEVTEGHDILRKLNDVICDETHRPYQDVRITHTVVLEDPFNDPLGLRAPSRSPSPSAERLKGGRIAPDEEIDETQGKSAAEIQEMIEEKEAKARATILEIVGDLPDADIAPPENVLFVCKLNPVTTDEDLEIIFSRFGKIVSCEVIRDKKSGDSLQYAFIEFSDKKSCEDAYLKMDNVLIDDRRIHVDFSQSVSKMKWLGKGRGVKYFNDNDSRENRNDLLMQSENRHREGQKNKEYNKNRENYNHSKRHENIEQDRIKRKQHREDRHERDRKEKSYRDRSRSRSRLEKSREESQNNKKSSSDKSNHSEDKKHSKNSYKVVNNDHKQNNSIRHENSSWHKSRSLDKSDKSNISSRKNKEKSDKHERNDDRNNHRSDKNFENNNMKYIDEHHNSYEGSKKSKTEKRIVEPRTPSPVVEKRIEKNSNIKKEKVKKVVKKSRNSKKKRKPSTSSSESDTSSSSDSSSSSEDTSSSSESSTSSSSTSTDSTSSSSSSESDHKKRKRRKKTVNSKVEKKSKIKL